MNKQFRQYVSLFDTTLVGKLLNAQGEPEIKERQNRYQNYLNRLEDSTEDYDIDDFYADVRTLPEVEDIVFKLSNTFLDVSVDGNPYKQTMTLPLNEKFAHISILMKYISTLNRLSVHYDGKPYKATEAALNGLSTKINMDTLQKFNDVAWTKIPIEGPGVIKYDMSIYNELIEQVEANLTKVKEAYESRTEEGILL